MDYNEVNDVSINTNELAQLISKIENVEKDMDDLKEDKKEIYTEAKSLGYCSKTIRKVVALRRKDSMTISMEETMIDLYKKALGMETDED